MGRKSSTNVLSRFLSQPAEYGLNHRLGGFCYLDHDISQLGMSIIV